MIKVNVHDKDAQQVVMKTLYPESGVKMRIEGELELYDITEALVVELFKNLLHKNLVSEVTFLYEEEKNSKKEARDVQKSRKYETHTEDVYGFLAENRGRAFSIKEISDKTGIAYSSVNNIIRKLYKSTKVQRNSDKKYFCSIEGDNVEQPQHEPTEKPIGKEEKKETAGDEEAQSKEAATSQQKESPEVAEGNNTQLSKDEKMRLMQQLFLNENYEDVLKYIFFSDKNKFVVKLAQKKFSGPRAQQLSDVINALNKAEVIVFNDGDDGSYEISLSWRIWAYLFTTKSKKSSAAMEVLLHMTMSECNDGIKEALEKGMVKKEVDEKHKTIYCVA